MDKRVIYVRQDEPDKLGVLIPMNCGLTVEEIANKDLPSGTLFSIVNKEEVPVDFDFMDAWEFNEGNTAVVVNLNKAKEIAHEVRRRARIVEMAPLDTKSTIPFEAVAAEEARQVLRDKYAGLQADIDAATDAVALKTIMEQLA
jgi:hypothetical protein